MKLYCFYFSLPFDNSAKECKLYFGDEDDIAEIARKLWSCDDSFLHYEEFLMESDT